VDISLGLGWWTAPQPYPGPRWPPPTGIAVAARQAASGYALCALPQRRTHTNSWDINLADRGGLENGILRRKVARFEDAVIGPRVSHWQGESRLRLSASQLETTTTRYRPSCPTKAARPEAQQNRTRMRIRTPNRAATEIGLSEWHGINFFEPTTGATEIVTLCGTRRLPRRLLAPLPLLGPSSNPIGGWTACGRRVTCYILLHERERPWIRTLSVPP
jgi:hypothetical protein